MDKQLLEQRIAQWEDDDRRPGPFMGWFSLGGAYKESGGPEEAARAAATIELDPGLSRAYQLLGQLLQSS